jgi:predicted peptidase
VPVQQKGWIWDSPRQFEGYPDAKVSPRVMRGLAGAVQLVNSLMKEYPVDPKRVYVIGCSEGGFGAFGAALKYPDLFAAAVPISGGWTFSEAPLMTKMPLWVFQGAQDTSVLPSLPRTLTSLIKRNGGTVNYTELPDEGHDCPSPRWYTSATWKWLFSQHK